MRIVVKDMNYDRDLADLFQQSYGEAVRAARNLSVSIKRTTSLFPLSAAAMAQLDDEALERLDAFRVRYAQLQDVLAGKVFRALLHLEEESADSMLDTLNAMEKRGIIDSFDAWKALRDLRNTFMHDYPEQAELRAEALTRAHARAAELCGVLLRVRERAMGRIGLPAGDLPEVPRCG